MFKFIKSLFLRKFHANCAAHLDKCENDIVERNRSAGLVFARKVEDAKRAMGPNWLGFNHNPPKVVK